MIKTIPIAPERILEQIPPSIEVGILGCGDCAAAQHHADTKQLEVWVDRFRDRNPVAFAVMTEAPCDQRVLKRFLSLTPGFDRAKIILTLACPVGQQSLISLLQTSPAAPRIVSGLTSGGAGWLGAGSRWNDACRFCDTCSWDASLPGCPVTRCPLRRTDGPCQTRNPDGTCPTEHGLRCIWLSKTTGNQPED